MLRGEIGGSSGSAPARRRRSAGGSGRCTSVQAQGGALPVILRGDDPVARAVAVRHLTSLATLDARIFKSIV